MEDVARLKRWMKKKMIISIVNWSDNFYKKDGQTWVAMDYKELNWTL